MQYRINSSCGIHCVSVHLSRIWQLKLFVCLELTICKGVSINYSLHVIYCTKHKYTHMCIQTKCQCYFSKNMEARARGQWSNFQHLNDRQWKWSSLASYKYCRLARIWVLTKRFSTWAWFQLMSMCSYGSLCMCLYWAFFLVNGCCISTSVHVCACEDRFRPGSKSAQQHRQYLALTLTTKGLDY